MRVRKAPTTTETNPNAGTVGGAIPPPTDPTMTAPNMPSPVPKNAAPKTSAASRTVDMFPQDTFPPTDPRGSVDPAAKDVAQAVARDNAGEERRQRTGPAPVEVKLPPQVDAALAAATRLAPDSAALEYVDVTHGEELYGPLQFHSYRVGPLSMRVYLRAGESHADAIDRGTRVLEEAMKRMRVVRRATFMAHLKEIGAVS